MTVATGSKTNIQIDRVYSHYLPKPYSECTTNIDGDASELVQGLLSKGYSYRQQDCFMACFQTYSVQMCECYDVYIQLMTLTPKINETKYGPCANITQVICISKVSLVIIFFNLRKTKNKKFIVENKGI